MFSPIANYSNPVVYPQPLYSVPQVYQAPNAYQTPQPMMTTTTPQQSIASPAPSDTKMTDVQPMQMQTQTSTSTSMASATSTMNQQQQQQQNAALAMMAIQQQQQVLLNGMNGGMSMTPVPGMSPIPGYTMVAVNLPYAPTQNYLPFNYAPPTFVGQTTGMNNVQTSPVLQSYPSTGNSLCRSNSTVSSTPSVPVLKPVTAANFNRSSSVTSSVVDGSDYSENGQDNGSTMSFSRDGYGSERSFRTLSESGSDTHQALETPNVGSPLTELSTCVFNLAEVPRVKKYTPYWDPNIKQAEENYMTTGNTVVVQKNKTTTTTTKTFKAARGKRYKHFYKNGFGPDGKKRPTSKERREELYKSDLCNSWINGKTCRFGKNCIYAHGIHELRKPKRKVERMRNRLAFKDEMLAGLTNMNQSNFDTLSTQIIARCVEELSDNDKCKAFVDLLYDRAISEKYLQRVLFCKLWEKLINIHHFRGLLKTEMNDKCICEYKDPRNRNIGLAVTSWISELCKKNLFNKALIHEMLTLMMNDDQKSDNKEKTELKLEMWCRMIEWVHNFMDVKKYVVYLNEQKDKVGAKVRFMIMNLDYLDSGRVN